MTGLIKLRAHLQRTNRTKEVDAGLFCLALLLLAACGGDSTSPIADAGPDQFIASRSLVTLSGGSTGVNSDKLVYRWRIVRKPENSRAKLSDTDTRNSTFAADVAGSYVIGLKVSDSEQSSPEDITEVVLNTTSDVQSQHKTVVDAWGSLQAAIYEAGSGARIDLNPDLIYKLTSSVNLRNYSNIVIDGHGATILRADAAEVSTTLNADYDGSTRIEVSSVPGNFRIGDQLVIPRGQSVDDASIGPRTIVSIEGNFITVDNPFGGSYPKGRTVFKSFPLIRGLPSGIEGGSNPGIILQNIVFDGNARNNNINYGWTLNGTIFLHGGKTSEIRFNRFVDISNENIIGHGFKIHHNTFDGLNGSALHTSVNDKTKIINTPASFTNNAVFNPNRIARGLNGHSEGAITFSWGPGAYISDNFFLSESGNYGVFGNFSGSSPNANVDLTIKNNYAYGFEYIIRIVSPLETPTHNILMSYNTFDDSGDIISSGIDKDTTIRLGCNNAAGEKIMVAPANSACE